MGIQCNTRYGNPEYEENKHLPCNGFSAWQCSGCLRSPYGNAGKQPDILDEIAALTPERRKELGLDESYAVAPKGEVK